MKEAVKKTIMDCFKKYDVKAGQTILEKHYFQAIQNMFFKNGWDIDDKVINDAINELVDNRIFTITENKSFKLI